MLRLFPILLSAFLFCFCLVACNDEETKTTAKLDLRGFTVHYNDYIGAWIEGEIKGTKAMLAETQQALAEASLEKQKKLNDKLTELKRDLEKYEFRQSLGDYFQFKAESDIPTNLVWKSGQDEPEIGDPRAKKGGRFRYFFGQFPATLRPFGPNSNHSFRSRIYDEIEIPLLGMHPDTLKAIPGCAQRWAYGEDGRTVFFELDPDAKYNDGMPIKAEDFLTAVYVRISDNVTTPYYKQYYRDQYAQMTAYGDKYLSFTIPEPKPFLELYAGGGISPAAPHFYAEYGPDYSERYQWKVPPTSGAYFVRKEDVQKGRSITLTRAKDWWAKDKKYYRYRYNPDEITYILVRDAGKAFEMFRANMIDMYEVTAPAVWYDKTQIKEVFDGYIERFWFYTDYPRVPRGIYLNVANGILQNRDVRLGIQHALNFQKVIDVITRGDFSRLQRFSEGFREFANRDIHAREFSIQKARDYFAKAGYTREDSEGFLISDNGQRLALSITFANAPSVAKVMDILKEEAKKVGLEIKLDAMEATLSYKTVMAKEHQSAYWGWGATPPTPSYHQFFHSSNAVDENGNLKPGTNNINSYQDPQMDEWVTAHRNARTPDELRDLSLKIQQKVYDEAIFVPAFKVDFYRVACWRWLRWPDTDYRQFNQALSGGPIESYLFWIDKEMKEETLKARKEGNTFPEVRKVIETYRVK